MSNSNINDIVRFLGKFVDAFYFKRPGIECNVGRDLLKAGVESISRRASDEQAGADGIWLANEPKYAKSKATRYNISENEPNVRTGQMLSEKSFTGRSTVESREVTMIYETGEAPSATLSAAQPVYARGPKKGQPIDTATDLEKAYYTHTGQSKHKIMRSFVSSRRATVKKFRPYARRTSVT
jgi:hypothetical protein